MSGLMGRLRAALGFGPGRLRQDTGGGDSDNFYHFKPNYDAPPKPSEAGPHGYVPPSELPDCNAKIRYGWVPKPTE